MCLYVQDWGKEMDIQREVQNLSQSPKVRTCLSLFLVLRISCLEASVTLQNLGSGRTKENCQFQNEPLLKAYVLRIQASKRVLKGQCRSPGNGDRSCSIFLAPESPSLRKSFFLESFHRHGLLFAACARNRSHRSSLALAGLQQRLVKAVTIIPPCHLHLPGACGTLQLAPWAFAGLSRIFRETCSKIAQPTFRLARAGNCKFAIAQACLQEPNAGSFAKSKFFRELHRLIFRRGG